MTRQQVFFGFLRPVKIDENDDCFHTGVQFHNMVNPSVENIKVLFVLKILESYQPFVSPRSVRVPIDVPPQLYVGLRKPFLRLYVEPLQLHMPLVAKQNGPLVYNTDKNLIDRVTGMS
jgi:hypothetical protein